MDARHDGDNDTLSLFDREAEAVGASTGVPAADDTSAETERAVTAEVEEEATAERTATDNPDTDMSDAENTPDADEPAFEEALAELDRVVKRMQSPECSLDEAMKLFTRGTKLTAYCHRKLEEVEARITVLTETADGTLHEEDIEI